MEQNAATEMAQLSEVTINIPEISEATEEQSPVTFLNPALPSFCYRENPDEEVEEDSWKMFIKQRLGDLPDKEDDVPNGFLIARIPHSIREKNKMYLDPQLVSIGPYHRGRENLCAMEKQKVCFLRDFLARSPGVSVDELIEKMKSHECRARQFYFENIELDSGKFVEMLLLDACFIAEFIHKFNEGGRSAIKLGPSGTVDLIFSDILLIENQIPFFVLESILDASIIATTLGLYNFLGLHQSRDEPPSCQIAHSVHFFYELNRPSERTLYESNSEAPTYIKLKQLFTSMKSRFLSQPEKQNNIKEPVYVIPSASELREAGVTFKKKQSHVDLLDITFNKGIIEMPPILVDDTAQRILLNVLAFEQSKGDDEFLFLSSYLYLLMFMLRTSKDVAILRQCGIISNFEANEEESALFFNRVGDMIVIDPDSNLFNELFSDIKDYYKRSWHQYKAKLKRDYFSNPWSIISLGAGLVLLVLTFLQTLYGIKSYKHS